MEREETEYHSRDFEWEELKQEIESKPSFSYHFLPFQSSPSSSSSSSLSPDSDAWQSFHARHFSGKFFKERRYLLKEFPELVSCDDDSKILEVGCGNGSTVLSILRGNANIIVYACDCSTEALERAKEIIDTADGVSFKQRFHPFHCDISASGLPKWLRCDSCQENHAFSKKDHSEVLLPFPHLHGKVSNSTCVKDLALLEGSTCCIGGMDFLTLIFTLSAVPFQKMPLVLTECFSVLKPGGLLLFRDYGLYDMTMLRFEPDKRVGFREYMRSDGTRSYFFSLDTVRGLFVDAGFVELELEYCCVKSVNRRNGKCMKRVWVHGKFQKPELLS